MIGSVTRLSQLTRLFSTGMEKRKVAILGAAGGIGQPLSLLMKLEPATIRHLALYDIANMGMYADIGHISTSVRVSGHQGEAELKACLEGCNIVMIPAGVPRKPGMTRDDLFNINAGIVKNLAQACAKYCPQAHILVISNPVNSTVPIAWETMKANGVAKPSVFGVTTLDTIRSRTFVGELKGTDPALVDVQVVGGHSGPTIVPLLSTIRGATFTQEQVNALDQRIQYGGDEVVKAKAGAGSATLSMAFAAREFYRTIVAALDGVKPAAEAVRPIAFVKTDKYEPGYFAAQIEVDRNGLKAVQDLPNISAHEKKLLEVAIRDLKKDVQKGIDFVKNQSQSATA